MKILYHHRIASKDGQYVHVEELTDAFRKLGHEIIFVGPRIVEEDDFGSDGGFVFYLKKYMPKVLYELVEFSYSLYAYLKLRRAVIKHKPDFLYERYNLYMTAGVWIKKKYNLPMVLEVNAPIFSERNKYDGLTLKKLAEWTEKYVWKNADLVLPVTKVLADIIKSAGVQENHIHVVPNGVNLDRFKDVPDLVTAKSNINLSGKLVLGFTGFMRDWHGLERVIDIIAELKSIEMYFLLVGDGPARATIEKRAKKLGVSHKLKITGIVKRNEIINYVSAFDIALQPDVVDYASPLKLFEYMVLGRAIIAPQSPNIREVLTNNVDSLLFERNDRDDFEKKINILCLNDELRARLGKAARKKIIDKEYIWESNAGKIIKLVGDTINDYSEKQ